MKPVMAKRPVSLFCFFFSFLSNFYYYAESGHLDLCMTTFAGTRRPLEKGFKEIKSINERF